MAEQGAFPPFRPRFPWWGRHLQTVRNTVAKPAHSLPPGREMRFAMPDGSGDVLLGRLNFPGDAPESEKPLAVLLHGLTGSEDSFYVRATTRLLLGRGHPVLRLNLRGAGSSASLCSRRYHAGRTGDVRAVLAGLSPDLTANGVILVGWSLGGNCTLKFLGEGDFPVPVLAGAAISAPIDLAASSRLFGARPNRLYHNRLLGQMKADMQANRALVGDRWADAALSAIDLWDFDDKVVAPWNGWADAPEYYRVNSALAFLLRIQVPTLVVHALDDPWIPPAAYRDFPWSANPRLHPAISRCGGHVGFHGADGIWSDRCLDLFLSRL
ncbi:YheT family hydrolase [Niveispirillum sp. KHB5.9]|uniref:YheT family hydrolase n=1 Tax=Niveispirillum sp. KHB5.9 TaxID=3400269 RepID=UPI003A8B557D